MNPDWETPPNGDFASYVERLTAQMALPRPELQQAPNVIDDVGERSQMQAHQMVQSAAAAAPGTTDATSPGAINVKLVRGVLLAVVVLMAVLHLVFNVSVFVLALVAVALGWIAYTLRGIFSGRGTAALRAQIERAARQAGRHP